MYIRYYDKIKKQQILEGIKQLLIQCDKEFYPPLSARGSTTQTELADNSCSGNGIDDYYKEIAEQSAVVMLDGHAVVGFISFRKNYVCEYIPKEYIRNIYVTTVIVSPKNRHQNIAGKMYDFLENRFAKRYIFTRTWSTNNTHIRILLSHGFHEHCILSND